MIKQFTAIAALALLGSCTVQRSPVIARQQPLTVDGKMFTAFFQQRAGEYKALCFQAYNLATLRVGEELKTTSSLPRAVVTDIDETVLDNSPYAVHRSLQGLDYTPDTWKEWTKRAEADTLCGAKTFFNYAAANNVEVFYITNRDEDERESTLANLKKFGFPYADNAHLILRQPKTSSSKEERRQALAKTHNIVLLLGDNLADFSPLFDSKIEMERNQRVQNNKDLFGQKFIVLPNAGYGDWEAALYKQLQGEATPARKDSLIRAVLKKY